MARVTAAAIDQAQEAGRDALRRAAFGPIPSYMKAMKDLGLTPNLGALEDAAAQDPEGGDVVSLDRWMQGA